MISVGGLVLINDLLFIRVCLKKIYLKHRGDLVLLLGFLYICHSKNVASTRLARRAGGGEEGGVLKMTDARRGRAQCFMTGTETPFVCV